MFASNKIKIFAKSRMFQRLHSLKSSKDANRVRGERQAVCSALFAAIAGCAERHSTKFCSTQEPHSFLKCANTHSCKTWLLTKQRHHFKQQWSLFKTPKNTSPLLCILVHICSNRPLITNSVIYFTNLILHFTTLATPRFHIRLLLESLVCLRINSYFAPILKP